jgi:CO/xanthine dehydrogenase Mo-binding subunit
MGQGALTASAQFLSHAIGWPYDRIVVQAADTDRDPRSGMTTASRQTFLTGNAVLMAAEKLKNRLGAFLEKEFSPGPGGFIIKDGSIIGADSGKRIVSLPELSAMAVRKGVKLYGEDRYSASGTYFSLKEPAGGYPPGEDRLHAAYCFAAHAVILDVNVSTGKLDIRKVIAASDVGRAANPMAVEGQIEGGVIMGLGYALSEEFKIEKGIIKTDTLGKLGLRRIGQTPEIESIIVDSPHPDGPYGAKGMAELPLSPVAPAVAHAIYRAAGVWINSLPITSEKILAALVSIRQH